jgi:hypothetical protein
VVDALVEQAKRECVALLRDPELDFDSFVQVAWFVASSVTSNELEQERIVRALWDLPLDPDLDVWDGVPPTPIAQQTPTTSVFVVRRTGTRSRAHRPLRRRGKRTALARSTDDDLVDHADLARRVRVSRRGGAR